jgi:hypothetical protein
VRLRGGSGAARRTVWCRVGGTGRQKLGCLGRQAVFGGVAERRETGEGPELGHRLAPDPSAESQVTIPSATAMNQVLLSKGLEINDLGSSLHEIVSSWAEGRG